MSDKPDNDTILLTQMIGLDALVNLLIDKGIITNKELVGYVKKVRDKIAEASAKKV